MSIADSVMSRIEVKADEVLSTCDQCIRAAGHLFHKKDLSGWEIRCAHCGQPIIKVVSTNGKPEEVALALSKGPIAHSSQLKGAIPIASK